MHVEDFFQFAKESTVRFDCAAGNPPFIRYQRFSGETRRRALAFCASRGANFNSLCSSWAPFLVAAAETLKKGGRMAFVAPAEIGHAPYAVPLLEYLLRSFGLVQLVAIRERVFSQLSQDVWLLYASGYGDSSDTIGFTAWEKFRGAARPPRPQIRIGIRELREWRFRLRPFLMPADARDLYAELRTDDSTSTLGSAAKVGIGYVTGANSFFHLRPSEAEDRGIPRRFLVPSVLNGRMLSAPEVSPQMVDSWLKNDEKCLLLRLRPGDQLPESVQRYLNSEGGDAARSSYKCANRKPWYVVPDVTIPDGFLSYMSGAGPRLVANDSRCVCTNSLHAVRCTGETRFADLVTAWAHPLTKLSAEVEGHPLGGGMLKIEPREAARIVLPLNSDKFGPEEVSIIEEGTETLRAWRHYG